VRPFFSVITPAYNASSFVLRCYQNLNDQSFQNWEWIFVDDGSTDNTLDLVKSINDNRIKIISYRNNCGRGHARNIALDNCLGDWTVCFDVDDLHFPEKLSLIHEKSNLNIDFFCSYGILIDNQIDIKGVRGFSEAYGIFPRGFLHPTMACKTEVLKRIKYSINPGPGGPSEDAKVIWILALRYNGYWHEDALIFYQEEREVNIQKAFWSNFGHLKTVQQLRQEKVILNRIKYLKTVIKYYFKLIILGCFYITPKFYKYTIGFRSNGKVSDNWVPSPDKISYLKKFKN